MSYVTDIVAYAEQREAFTVYMLMRDLYGIEKNKVSWPTYYNTYRYAKMRIQSAIRQGWIEKVPDQTAPGEHGQPLALWRAVR